MKYRQLMPTNILACLLLLFYSGISSSGVGTTGSGRFFGEISDFGSIWVNGVEYSTSGANIIINGIGGQPESALKLGMAVRVEGTINMGGTTGTATVVEYLGDIEGKVDAAPTLGTGGSGSFAMHGIVITTSGKTRYDGVANLAAILAGDTLEISGFFNANDSSFAATRIEKKSMFTKIDLRGFVSNVTATTFQLGPSLIVNYATAVLHDPPTGPVNGQFVEVKATTLPVAGVLTATRVSGEGSVLRSADEPLGVLQGVAASVTPTSLVMGNQPIVVSGATVFDGAPAAALVAGAKAIAVGPVVMGVLNATFITIAPQLVSVESRKVHGAAGSFPLSIATGVDIAGAVTVEPRTLGSGHTLVFQFNGPINTIGGVTSKDAGGVTDVGMPTFSVGGSTVTVNLGGVPDNRRARITITNINQLGVDASVSVGFLLGDVSNTQKVTAADISTVKARGGQTLGMTIFLADVNLSGTIDAIDLAAVKARAGMTLAP